jgi:cell division initiation protein
MIELTPLDVRKKRGDFRRGMRGYDSGEVDTFLELVAERFEVLVKENLTLKERAARLSDQVKEQQEREKAVQEALVTAQALRDDIGAQAQREADLLRREAEAEIERLILDAENRVDDLKLVLEGLDRRRRRFLRAYRLVLERELDVLDVEESRDPLEEKPLELELFGSIPGSTSGRRGSGRATGAVAAAEGEESAGFTDLGGDPAIQPKPEGAGPAATEREPSPPQHRGTDVPERSAGGERTTGEVNPGGLLQSSAEEGEWVPPWRFSFGQREGDQGGSVPNPPDGD